MTAAQVGKTEILLNVIGCFIDQEPSPILVLQPTLDMGQSFSKDRLDPMIRDTPALQGKIKEARSRDSGNTIMHKKFLGGHVTISATNSPVSLASRPIRVLLCDEVDRYPPSSGKEGDPLTLAIKNPDEKKIRGFHMNAFASGWASWPDLIKQYREAFLNGEESLKGWWNTVLGLPFENTEGTIEAEVLESHREEYPAELPDGVLVLTCGVDTQDNCLECEVVGWGVGHESWGIEYRAIVGRWHEGMPSVSKPSSNNRCHYGASRTKPSVSGWYSRLLSPHEDITDNLELLRERSRDLYAGAGHWDGAQSTES